MPRYSQRLVSPRTKRAAAPAARKPRAKKIIYVTNVPAEAHRALKLFAVQEGRDMSDIALDAINEYFQKRGLPPIQ